MKGLFSLLGLIALTVTVVADEAAFRNITLQYKNQLRNQLSNNTSGCNGRNVAVRREWFQTRILPFMTYDTKVLRGTLSRRERKNYIDAVKCLQRKPPKSPVKLVPGARSRYDDFVAVHIYQNFDVHFNAVFLPWHRYFVWQYEKALREECGYKGYQPYWEWSQYSNDLETSPVFDGSEYSMSGNGESIPHGNVAFTLPRVNLSVSIPPGTGGGCVCEGPFKEMQVNLGPTRYITALEPAVGSGSGLDYNPRCLKRDLNPQLSRERLNYDVVTELLTNTANYADLVGNLGRSGVHPSGHQAVGGVMIDAFSSAVDPSFYLHHAQVDRMWSIWQSLDQPARQNQLLGTTTWFNVPPSPNITADFPIGLAWEAPEKAAVDLTNTIQNDFCYTYE